MFFYEHKGIHEEFYLFIYINERDTKVISSNDNLINMDSNENHYGSDTN